MVFNFSKKDPITKNALSWYLKNGVCQKRFATGTLFLVVIPIKLFMLTFLFLYGKFESFSVKLIYMVILLLKEHQLKIP